MPEPSGKEREEYLLLLYFGAWAKSPIGRCVCRAYRDMNRTLHGLRSHAAHQQLSNDAHTLVVQRLKDLLRATAISSQSDFDAWHRQLATDLCSYYRDAGYASFSVGQAQKWINMALKYAVIFGDERIPGISRLYPWLHAPIDNVVLNEMTLPDAPARKISWSRLTDYSEYFSLQRWIRKTYPSEAPLAVEFRLWRRGMEKSNEVSG